MSIYAQFDQDGEQHQIASNQGWGDFCDWNEGLDSETYPNLFQLVEYGITENISDLAKEITNALRDSPPEKETADVAGELLDALNSNPGASVVLITNGIGPAAGNGNDEQS